MESLPHVRSMATRREKKNQNRGQVEVGGLRVKAGEGRWTPRWISRIDNQDLQQQPHSTHTYAKKHVISQNFSSLTEVHMRDWTGGANCENWEVQGVQVQPNWEIHLHDGVHLQPEGKNCNANQTNWKVKDDAGKKTEKLWRKENRKRMMWEKKRKSKSRSTEKNRSRFYSINNQALQRNWIQGIKNLRMFQKYAFQRFYIIHWF